MKIGELAAQAGCDVQTVRYYEREALLEAPEREASGYRRYALKHLARLRFIRQLIEYADAPQQSCAEVDVLLDEHIAQVHQRVVALTALERKLTALRAECKGANATRARAPATAARHNRS